MFSITTSGSFKNTEAFLRAMTKLDIVPILHRYGRMGVGALGLATPVLTGLVSTSWNYEVENSKTGATIWWTNTDRENGFPVAIMLQYGHGTGTGGNIQGQDYINPAIRPIFDEIANEVWKAVTSA